MQGLTLHSGHSQLTILLQYLKSQLRYDSAFGAVVGTPLSFRRRLNLT
jgi:hypothetical protein